MSGAVFWFTGLPCSGKTTLCEHFAAELRSRGNDVEVLDGDTVRAVTENQGFSLEERGLHLRYVALTASLLEQRGVIVLCSFVSPQRASREFARSMSERFYEIYVATPLNECERRDTKGLYAKARRGELRDFTGVNSPYESPLQPELTIDTYQTTIESNIAKLELLLQRGSSLADRERGE